VFHLSSVKERKTKKKKDIQGVPKLVIQKSAAITSELEVTL
jgi:hypothetical protein